MFSLEAEFWNACDFGASVAACYDVCSACVRFVFFATMQLVLPAHEQFVSLSCCRGNCFLCAMAPNAPAPFIVNGRAVYLSRAEHNLCRLVACWSFIYL